MTDLKKLVARVSISGLVLFVVLRGVDFPSLLDHVRGAKVWALAASFACILVNYVFSSYRWQALAEVKGIKKSLGEFVRLYFIGAFFNNFLPTSVGGDVVKAYKLAGTTDKKVDAVSSVFMERLTGVLVLALISWGGFLYYFWPRSVLVSLGLLVAGVVGIGLSPKLARLHPLLQKFYDSVISYRNERAVLKKALWTSFVVQVFAITTQYLVLVALGIKVSYLYCLFVVPIITVASMAPFSINGLGIQDGLYVFFFERAGVMPTEVLAASFVYHTLRLASSLVGGFLYLF